MLDNVAVRWVLAIVIALAIVGLIAYARGKPGAGGRAPDQEHAHAVAASVISAPRAAPQD